MTNHNRKLLTFSAMALAAMTLSLGLAPAEAQDDEKIRDTVHAWST